MRSPGETLLEAVGRACSGQPVLARALIEGDDILGNGRRFYRPERAYMPVEFQGACYRMGHSMVRPSYRANLGGDKDGSAFFGMVFVPDGAEGNSGDPIDLRGGARAPRSLGL